MKIPLLIKLLSNNCVTNDYSLIKEPVGSFSV